jgi:hypothetical protein
MGASLGWGDGGLEGDMGLEPDGPPSPRPSTKPPQTNSASPPPMRSEGAHAFSSGERYRISLHVIHGSGD